MHKKDQLTLLRKYPNEIDITKFMLYCWAFDDIMEIYSTQEFDTKMDKMIKCALEAKKREKNISMYHVCNMSEDFKKEFLKKYYALAKDIQ